MDEEQAQIEKEILEFKVDNDLGDCRKLLVKNPNHISEKALRNLFKRYGPIKELTVTPEYTLIEYEHYNQAENAYTSFKGCTDFDLKVYWAWRKLAKEKEKEPVQLTKEFENMTFQNYNDLFPPIEPIVHNRTSFPLFPFVFLTPMPHKPDPVFEKDPRVSLDISKFCCPTCDEFMYSHCKKCDTAFQRTESLSSTSSSEDSTDSEDIQDICSSV